MAREPKPDFERYMTALHCEEPECVRRLLLEALEYVGLGGLVRPGK